MSVQNQTHIIGNIGRVETRYTPSGTAVTSLSIAVNEREKVGEQWQDVTTWFPCTLWKHEGILNYLQPGKQVAVTARFKTREYEKDGEKRKAYDFVIDDIKLLGGKKEDAPADPPLRSMPRGSSAPKQAAIDDPNDPDFVPF
jgi:single-strand DNA-binding protein